MPVMMKLLEPAHGDHRSTVTMAIAFLIWLTGSLVVLSSAGFAAQSETPPRGPIVLSIELPGQKAVDFSIEDLDQLGVASLETATPWTKGKTKFEGVYLKRVLAATGAKGTQIKAVALNDYASHLPFDDAEKNNVLLAYKIDGKHLTVRDKGPLWIVYPFDQDPSLKQETIYSRSVWQLRKLVVIE